MKKGTIRCHLVLVLLRRRAVRYVNSRRTDKSAASATRFFCSRSQNRQYTSDDTLRRGIDPRFGRRLDFGAVGSVLAAATMVKVMKVR